MTSLSRFSAAKGCAMRVPRGACDGAVVPVAGCRSHFRLRLASDRIRGISKPK